MLSEPFHERLRAAALTDPLRLSIGNSLAVLLEDDGDSVVPDDRSFATLLKFLSDHPRWVAPGLTVDRQGAFVAIWEIPGVFRWSLAFLPVGKLNGRHSKKAGTRTWLDTPVEAAPTRLSSPGSCDTASWHISRAPCTVRGDPLPAEHYVARHCRNKDLILTNGEPTGVSESAFEPKPDETDGLSANWLEFFGNDRQHNVAGVRSVTRLTVRGSHRIAILNVGAINAAGGSAILGVVEDPIDDLAPYTNAAHALIKEIAALKDRALRDVLAFLVQQSDIERY